MSIRSLAEGAASKADAAIEATLSKQEQEAMTKAIESAITAAIRTTMQQCQDAAGRCVTGDQVKKKIVIEINKSATAQFPDMGSMR